MNSEHVNKSLNVKLTKKREKLMISFVSIMKHLSKSFMNSRLSMMEKKSVLKDVVSMRELVLIVN